MAKTMQEWFEDYLAKEFYEGTWRFRGTEFMRVVQPKANECHVVVHLSCGYGWVKSRIFSDHLGIENSVRMFTGQTAAEDCIKWTAFKSREAIEEAAKRAQPYENGHKQYLKALRGE